MTQEPNEAACREAFEKWADEAPNIYLALDWDNEAETYIFGETIDAWAAWQAAYLAADTSNKRLREGFIKSIQAALSRTGNAVDKLEFIKALVTKSNATFTESAIKGDENGK